MSNLWEFVVIVWDFPCFFAKLLDKLLQIKKTAGGQIGNGLWLGDKLLPNDC